MPDACFSHPRLARVYDPLDPDRSDLDTYVNLVAEFGAETVLDVGCGTASDVAGDTARRNSFDVATMTANVAQVFLDDRDWLSTLSAIRCCLRPGGKLVFETRDPADRAWERWTKEATHRSVDLEEMGTVEQWVETTHVEGEFVTFISPTIFHRDEERIDSTSTLRFRSKPAVERTLSDAGFRDVEVHDLPYAPGRGLLFIATAVG